MRRRRRRQRAHTHIAFAAWKIYFTDLCALIFPFTKQLCHPQSEIQLVVISERQSLQSLWNHKVSRGTAALYLSRSWWAALSLRGFSVLKTGTTYSASPTWVPRDLTCHLQDFFGGGKGVCFLYLLSRSGGTVLTSVPIVPLLRNHTKQYGVIDAFRPHPRRWQEQKTGWSHYNKCPTHFAFITASYINAKTHTHTHGRQWAHHKKKKDKKRKLYIGVGWFLSHANEVGFFF